MKKTAKYEMYINTENIFGPAVTITKKQFNAFLSGYKKEIRENHKKEEPFDADGDDNERYASDIDVKITEHEKYIETRYYICDSNSQGSCHTGINFVEMKCKDGYYWKK